MELFCYFNLVNRQFTKYWRQVSFSGDCTVPVQNNIDQSMLYGTVYIFILLLVCLPIAVIFIGHSYIFIHYFLGSFWAWILKTKISYYYHLKNYYHNLYILMSKMSTTWKQVPSFRYSHFEIHVSIIQQNCM